jgi:hypothetical protein
MGADEHVTPFGLALLRQSATLVHAVPGLIASVTLHGRPLADVSWQGNRTHPAVRWLPPCAFRGVVAQAVEQERAGRAVALLGLPPGGDPSVHLRALAPTTVHPLGLVAAVVGGRAVWAHATVSPPDAVAWVVEQVSAAEGGGAAQPAIDLVHDVDLDVTLVAVERSVRGAEAARARVLAEALLVATCSVGLDVDLERLKTGRACGPTP